MNYFIDTEFLEGTQKRMFGETKPTIDLISIGIVCEDGREYYAISKDFNLKEAWDRWQQRTGEGDRNNIEPKEYWIRNNVLKPIFDEFYIDAFEANMPPFCYRAMKALINRVGKTNKRIAEEIKDFVSLKSVYGKRDTLFIEGMSSEARMAYEGRMEILKRKNQLPQFYGYYCDYDWVVFCWLFGKMIDLPQGFPMYCIDLKQMLDVKYKDGYYYMNYIQVDDTYPSIIKSGRIDKVEKHPDYPKQTNEHSAIHDARWNFELYKFLTDTQWI